MYASTALPPPELTIFVVSSETTVHDRVGGRLGCVVVAPPPPQFEVHPPPPAGLTITVRVVEALSPPLSVTEYVSVYVPVVKEYFDIYKLFVQKYFYCHVTNDCLEYRREQKLWTKRELLPL
mgnify:CR=1 FL=1